MTEVLAELAETFNMAFWHMFMVFLRMGAALALLPVLGEQVVPVRIRLVVALCLTFIVAPLVPPLGATDGLPLTAFASEAIVGLALGAVIRMFVYALQITGEIAAQSASLSQIFGGSSVIDAQPAFGHVMLVGGLALACIGGLHVAMISALADTYALLPAGRFPDAAQLSGWGVGHMARAFSLAFTLAAPFLIASLVYNLALGLINRAMPQLMVALVGAPAISGGGIVILMLVIPLLLSLWLDRFAGFLAAPLAPLP